METIENRFLLTLDFKQKTIRSINFIQNNVGTSVLELSIVDGGQITDGSTGLLTGGNAVDITGQTVSIAFLKPDNTLVIQDATTGVTILGDPLLGKVQCVLMSNTLAVAGNVKAEVSFSKDGNKLSTAQFNFTVSGSLDNGSGVLSSNQIPVIDAKIVEWQSEFDAAESGRAVEFETIKAEYNLAIAENTNLEDIAARTSAVKTKTFATIDARFEESEQDLVSYKADNATEINDIIANVLTKLSKADIQQLIGFADINKNLSQIDSTMLTPALLAQIAGTAGVNVTPLALSVLTAMLADGAVTAEKMAKLTPGKNLFKPYTVTVGQVINVATGVLSANASYCTSDYIPVLPSTQYTRKFNRQIVFFDINKTYISGNDNGTMTITTPTNCYFIRVTALPDSNGQAGATLSTYQIELGASSTVYEPWNFDMDQLKIKNPDHLGDGVVGNNNLLDGAVTTPKVLNGAVTPIKLSIFKASTNLFNANSVDNIADKTLGPDGVPYTSTGALITHLIPVTPSTAYNTNGYSCNYGTYDISQVFIARLGSATDGSLTTGANVYFVKPLTSTSEKNTFMFILGAKALNYYIPFDTIDGNSIVYPSRFDYVGKYMSPWNDKMWTSFGDSITALGTWQTKVLTKIAMVHTLRGIGGTTVANTGAIAWVDSSGLYLARPPATQPVDSTQIYASGCTDDRIGTIPLTTQVLHIMFGTNDYAQNVPIGTINDVIDTTFMGGYITLLNKLYVRIPNARIIIMTHMYQHGDDVANTVGKTGEDYRIATRAVAYKFGYQVVDLKPNMGVNDLNYTTYTVDGTHPSLVGADHLAEVALGGFNAIEPLS